MINKWTLFRVVCNCGVENMAKLDERTHCSNCDSEIWVRYLKSGEYQPMVRSSRKLEMTMKLKRTHSEIIDWIS